jgi:arylsulfatase A-like enzyme
MKKLLIAVCWLAQSLGAWGQGNPPNVIIFLSDDQGWGDFSILGNQNLQTPHIDQIAQNGILFKRFYVQPVCSPTRAELLTGRYHPRCGVFSTSEGGERIALGETLLPEVFRQAGYATGAFGKWHSGMQPPYDPNSRGFSEFYGFCSGHWGHYFDPPLEHNGQLVLGHGYLPDDLTDRALAFMERHRRQPFFLYLPFNTPHSPMQVPDRWWAKFKDKDLIMRASKPEQEDVQFTKAALAMCENIDWNVGRVMQKLAELGLTENTIVLYFNDNGPYGQRWNGQHKGSKGSTDEGGVCSPLFLQYPKLIPPGQTAAQIGAAIDLFPTLLDLAGLRATPARPLDGISLKPWLTGGPASAPPPDRLIFAHWGGRVSVRTPRYLLDHQQRLYDLLADPAQTTDLAASQPQVAQPLATAVRNWRAEVLSRLDTRPQPFTVGHPAAVYTQLPARDAQLRGHLQRSNKYPNSSFITNWRSLADTIVWDIAVLEEGDFAVEIYYTCPPGETGSVFQLAFGNAQVVGKIKQAHDPPLRGMEQDRAPRIESYVKDFRKLKIGKIHLRKGEGKLVLKALSIANTQVMDFRTLVLKRIR